jgi:hypothetical protein
LQRLANIGREAIRLGGRGMEDDSEDMDLLSARKTFRRSDRNESQTSTGLAQTSLGNGNWFNRHAHQVPSTLGYTSNHSPPRDPNVGSISHPMPMQIPIAEMLNDPSWSQDQTGANPDTGLGNIGDFDVNAVSTSSTR